MALSESTPVACAINLTELIDHLKVTSSDEYPLVQLYADAAIAVAEKRTRRAMVNRTVVYETDCFPNCHIELPVSPVSAVTSVQYYDTGGTLSTFSSTNYVVDISSILPRIGLKLGYVWPSTDTRLNAVKVTFTAGYGATYDLVPAGLRMAVMMLASHFYENRTPVEVGSGSVMEVPMTLGFVLDAYKIASH